MCSALLLVIMFTREKEIKKQLACSFVRLQTCSNPPLEIIPEAHNVCLSWDKGRQLEHKAGLGCLRLLSTEQNHSSLYLQYLHLSLMQDFLFLSIL